MTYTRLLPTTTSRRGCAQTSVSCGQKRARPERRQSVLPADWPPIRRRHLAIVQMERRQARRTANGRLVVATVASLHEAARVQATTNTWVRWNVEPELLAVVAADNWAACGVCSWQWSRVIVGRALSRSDARCGIDGIPLGRARSLRRSHVAQTATRPSRDPPT